MTEDDQLMIRIQSGDLRAFDELVEKYQGPLIGFFSETVGIPNYLKIFPRKRCCESIINRGTICHKVDFVVGCTEWLATC